MSEPRIYMHHARRLRTAMGGRGVTCTPGIRTWCRENGIDAALAAKDGIAGEDALRSGDAFLLKLLEIARQEADANGR